MPCKIRMKAKVAVCDVIEALRMNLTAPEIVRFIRELVYDDEELTRAIINALTNERPSE